MLVRGRGGKPPRHEPEVSGSDNRIHVGNNANIAGLEIIVEGDRNEIEIGDAVMLRAKIHIQGNGSKVVIGERTTSRGLALQLTEGRSIRIGRDCMFSHGISVRTGDGHSIIDVASGKRINPGEDVTIGDHVWVGERAIILKGVRIADHCIVAAGAIASSSLDVANTVYGGIPARALRHGVSWERELI